MIDREQSTASLRRHGLHLATASLVVLSSCGGGSSAPPSPLEGQWTAAFRPNPGGAYGGNMTITLINGVFECQLFASQAGLPCVRGGTGTASLGSDGAVQINAGSVNYTGSLSDNMIYGSYSSRFGGSNCTATERGNITFTKTPPTLTSYSESLFVYADETVVFIHCDRRSEPGLAAHYDMPDPASTK